jgi:hypothetical protein
VNTPITVTYQFSELNIGTGQIEKIIGYDPGGAPEPIPEMITSALKSCEKYAEIKGVYLATGDYEVIKSKALIRANGQFFQTGKIVTNFISKVDQFVFFIMTAGKGIELQAQKYLSGDDPLLGYIYDVIGSLTVETGVEKTLKEIEEDFLQDGLMISNPYSPGYCGWPVTDQQKFFALFNNNTCGIKLSETCLMDPIKSISGIIGVGKNIKKQPYSCAICDLKNCLYRDKSQLSDSVILKRK